MKIPDDTISLHVQLDFTPGELDVDSDAFLDLACPRFGPTAVLLARHMLRHAMQHNGSDVVVDLDTVAWWLGIKRRRLLLALDRLQYRDRAASFDGSTYTLRVAIPMPHLTTVAHR